MDNVPVRYAMYIGDVNDDGTADLTDVVQISNDANVFVNGYNITDLTGDFSTDLSDVVLALNNASAFVSVKRP